MVFYHLLFYQIHRPFLTLDVVIFATSVCYFKPLPNGGCSNFLIMATFSERFPGKIYLPIKKLYLPIHLNDNADISAVCLSKSYWALFCLILLSIVLIYHWQEFYNRFFLNLNGLSDGKVVSFTRNKYSSLT